MITAKIGMRYEKLKLKKNDCLHSKKNLCILYAKIKIAVYRIMVDIPINRGGDNEGENINIMVKGE